MKKNIFLIFVLIAVSFSREYSLDELIDSAYKHSHLLAVADMMMERNKEAIDEAKRNMLPQITFLGNYSHAMTPYNSMAGLAGGNISGSGGDDDIAAFFNDVLSGFGEPPRNTLTGGIDFRQTIFAQNKLRRAVEYARVQGRSLICRWQDVRMRVKAEMTRLYYAALLAGEQSKIEEQSRNIAESRHQQTLSLFNSRILSEMDTLNSFIDFSQAAIRLAEAKRNEREIFRAIATAAGLSEPADEITLSDSLQPLPHRFDFDTLSKYFLAENKDLRVLANEVDLAEIRVKITKGDYYPVVFGGLSLNRIANFEGSSDFNFAPERKVYIGLSYDIAPFGQRRIRIKQSEYDLRIAKRNYEHRKEQLLLLLRSNYEMIIEEYAKMLEGKKILDAAEKALGIAQSRYANGLISQTDIDIAEQRFRQSGLMYLSAVSRYNSLLIDLRIMGADYLYEPMKKAEIERFDAFIEFYLRGE